MMGEVVATMVRNDDEDFFETMALPGRFNLRVKMDGDYGDSTQQELS
jgi:hypothetical protein